MQRIKINVRLEAKRAIVTTNIHYELPNGCSRLELIGNEYLTLNKIILKKKAIKYNILDFGEKVEITNLPQKGQLTYVAHNEVFIYDEQNLFYYENLKNLTFIPSLNGDTETVFKGKITYADKKRFPIAFISNDLILFAGHFTNKLYTFRNKTISIYTLKNEENRMPFLSQTINNLLTWQAKSHITSKADFNPVIAIPHGKLDASLSANILNSNDLPNPSNTNTIYDNIYAASIIANKYFQTLKDSCDIMRFLYQEFGSTILEPIHLKQMPGPCCQDLFTEVISGLSLNPNIKLIDKTNKPNITYRKILGKIENNFILIFLSNISANLKAKLLRLPSQHNIIISNPNPTIKLDNLINAYDQLETFLAIKFKQYWLNIDHLNKDPEFTYVCLKYQAKLNVNETSDLYLEFGDVHEKLYALEVICADGSAVDDVFNVLKNLDSICPKLSTRSRLKFYYDFFSNNLDLLHIETGQGYKLLVDLISQADLHDSCLAIKLFSLLKICPDLKNKNLILLKSELENLNRILNISQELNNDIEQRLNQLQNSIKPRLQRANLILA